MSATLIPWPVFQAFDNDGQFLVAGRLQSFAAGTSTPQATYIDSTLTTQNSNPIILDSRGSANVWLNPALAYKFVLRDSAGNLIWSVDNIVGPYIIGGNLVPVPTNTWTLGTPANTWANAYFGPNGAAVFDSATGNIGWFETNQAEQNAGVVPTNKIYPYGWPERYVNSSTIIYTNGTGTTPSATDFSAAINSALTIIGQPVTMGPHNYLCATAPLVMQNEQSFVGQGLNETGVVYGAGVSAGPALGWNLSVASKINLFGFTLYCNHAPNLTGGIVLGTNLNPYGTEGYIDQVMVRNLNAGALGFDINANIGEFGALYALDTAGIRILGSGISIVQMENTAASGFADVNGNQTCTEIQDGWIGLFELEAPASNNLLLTVRGQLVIDYFVPSIAASTTFTNLVYITSSASGTWEINIPQIYYGGSNGAGTRPTFNNLFFDQASGTAFGSGNTDTHQALRNMCGFFQGGLTTQGATFAIKKQQLNNFTFRIANNAGTVQHKISAVGQSTTLATWTASVNNAALAFTNTPTGADATTAFAAGAKISSADPFLVVLDTGAEVGSDVIMYAGITLNNTGTAYLLLPTVVALNINGVNQNRIAFNLLDPLAGTNVNWATALSTPGNLLDVTLLACFN